MITDVDVLVIGGGGAACRAAIAAADVGARVLMVLKRHVGRSGATTYKVTETAGFNAADGEVDPDDTPAAHYADMMAAGAGMADPALVQILAEEAPLALQQLVAWGVPFVRDGDHFLEVQTCFSTRPRTHQIVGHGEPIVQALAEQIRLRPAIRVLEDRVVTNLFVQDGFCLGAGLLSPNGQYEAVPAGAVILAAGGAGRLFAHNLYPPEICGDGYRLAYEAGAELINMEYMQAGVGICSPVTSLLSAWLWAAQPRLTNVAGEEFLGNYLPTGISSEAVLEAHARHFPFSSADLSQYVELAIQGEIDAGRATAHDGVYLDFRHVTAEMLAALPPGHALQKMWPHTRDFLLSRHVDLTRELVEVTCFGHAINGGVRITPFGESTVPGLFAAGEVAGGPHGADRLGGNMLVTCQVFGARAGAAAAAYASRSRAGGPAGTCAEIAPQTVAAARDELYETAARSLDVRELKRAIGLAAQQNLLVRRSEAGLTSFLEQLRATRREIAASPSAELPQQAVWEIGCLLSAGELMATAALARRESRGGHFRSDYPTRNDGAYKHPIALSRSTEGPAVRFV